MPQPTQAELEILNILWELGEARVQDVHERLNRIRPIGYTTALKSMQIMVQKQLLDRRAEGRGHVYFPAIPEQDTKSRMLKKFIETTFRGSSGNLLMHLLGNDKITPGEIEEVKTFLTKLEQDKSN